MSESSTPDNSVTGAAPVAPAVPTAPEPAPAAPKPAPEKVVEQPAAPAPRREAPEPAPAPRAETAVSQPTEPAPQVPSAQRDEAPKAEGTTPATAGRPARSRRTRKAAKPATDESLSAQKRPDVSDAPEPSPHDAATASPAPALDAPASAADVRPENAPERPARQRRAETPASLDATPAGEPQPSSAAEPAADEERPSKRSRRTRSKALPTSQAELDKMGIKMTPEISAALAAMPRRRRGRPSNEELQARKVLEDAIRRSEQQGDVASASAPAAASDPARPVEAAEARPADAEPTSQPASEGATAEQASQPSSQGEQREEGGYQRRSHRVRQGQDGGFVPRHQRNQQRNGQQQDGQTRADRDGQGGQQGRQDRQDRQDRDRQGGRNDRNDRQGGNGQQGRQRQDGRYGDRQGDRGDRQDRYNDRRQQRRDRNAREAVAPKANREELAELKVGELRTKATELGIEDAASLKKPELIEAVYSALVKQEGFFDCAGVLDLMQEGYGFIRTKGYLPSEGDVYVGAQVIRSSGLRRGDWLVGIGHASRPTDKFPALARLESVNGKPVEEMRNRPRFADLTPVFPDERLRMEHGKDSILGRCIDLVSPIGKGQRGLIVSPPKAGKTTVLKKIAESIAENNPEVHLICLLVDERPEEVTDMQRSIKGEVVASTFDMPSDSHITVSELVIERAKRLVELGQDVVILLDSITRLARAYNLAQPASGRILSGGVDSTALYPPKRFLGAARNIEGGGSLTILASALVETGSKMDEVIFEEFKGTGNMELKLDRDLADRRIFPAIDPIASGTRKEELLLEPGIAPFVWGLRRILANMNNNERAMSSLIKSLKATATNEEFLIRSAKKAQNQEIGADLQ